MFDEVVVVSVKDGGFYSDSYTSGSTVNVVLQRGNEFASCDGILIWEANMAEEAFEEWKELADCGEEGYKYWVEE